MIAQDSPHTYLCSNRRHEKFQHSSQDILNLLVLYGENSTFIGTVQEFLVSFPKYSKHNIFFASGIGQIPCFYELNRFDAVILSYSIRVSLINYISPMVVEALQSFDGLKILFLQDEYDTTETARSWIEKLGINLVFSVVPPQDISKVYPPERFPNTEFVSTLTGFVPEELEERFPIVPLKKRPIHIGYRGRKLAYWYGNLGREKCEIGVLMKKFCIAQNIPHDIEWEDQKRIYGDDWYYFLSNCRATLGTESGSNVFDDFGQIRQQITTALEKNPDLTYDEAFKQFIEPHEGLIKMNQISPKIFESIILRTALILFEGSYSGVIQPNKHFIPLKKDFSNINEVFEKLGDLDYIEKLTQTAYQDIVLSGQYSYKSFIKRVDQLIEERVKNPKNTQFVTGIVGYHHHSVIDSLFPWVEPFVNAVPVNCILDTFPTPPPPPIIYNEFNKKMVISHICSSCGKIQIRKEGGKKSFFKKMQKEITRIFKKKKHNKKDTVSHTGSKTYTDLCVNCQKDSQLMNKKLNNNGTYPFLLKQVLPYKRRKD